MTTSYLTEAIAWICLAVLLGAAVGQLGVYVRRNREDR